MKLLGNAPLHPAADVVPDHQKASSPPCGPQARSYPRVAKQSGMHNIVYNLERHQTEITSYHGGMHSTGTSGLDGQLMEHHLPSRFPGPLFPIYCGNLRRASFRAVGCMLLRRSLVDSFPTTTHHGWSKKPYPKRPRGVSPLHLSSRKQFPNWAVPPRLHGGAA